MQFKSDIIDAVANPRSRIAVLEEAFRALVAWPREGMIRGMTGTDDAIDLLGRVAVALADSGDTREMPDYITQMLDTIALGQGRRIVQGTYLSGAVYVRNNLEQWRTLIRHAKTDT